MPTLSGKTLIAANQPLSSANIIVYKSADNTIAASGTSDEQGNFSLTVPSLGPFFVVAYIVTPAFRAGTSRRDLMAVADTTMPPGAPVIGTAVAGNGYIDVYFDAPASNGGSPILDYKVKLSTGEEATGTASPIRIAIPNGTSASATVTARNTVSSGPASSASNVVTPVAPTNPAATVRSLWTGIPTTDGAHISARLNSSGSADSARLVVSTSESLTSPIKTPVITPDLYRIAKQTITGLLANTEYWYAVEVDGVVDPTTKGRFKTLPVAGPASFTVALGCCANNTAHSDKPWAAIRDAKPLLFIMLGDWTYSNSSWTAEADRIGQYDTCLTSPAIRQQVHSLTPTDYIYDDHDFGPDDATGLDDNNVAVPYRQASVDAFRRRFPAPLLSTTQTDAVDHSYVIGRVRFITMDCRSNRSGVYRADDSTKSMLGAAQKARWKAQIDAAAAASQVVCCISTIPWIGSGWGAYGTEVVELANYIKSKNMGGKVFFIAGDMHAMAYNAGYDHATGGGALTPVFQVGAMHSPFTSIKGGPYTQGPYGKAGTQTADGLTPNNYGTMEVVDDGTNLTIRWKGYDADAGVMRIRYSFAALGTLIPEPMAPQLKPAAPTAVPGNASAVVTVSAPQNAFPAITGITVQSDAGGTDTDAGTLELSHDVVGLTNNVPVKFRVKETNALGDSPWSDWMNIAVMPTASGGVIPPSTLQATGGTYTTPGDGYGYWEFLADGDFVVTQAGQAEVLTVPGGGAGSNGGTSAGGAGGGGFPLVGVYTIAVGTHRATIGAGGIGVTGQARGTSGGTTSLGNIQSVQGGGAGASAGSLVGLNGSSGGGGCGSSSPVAKGLGTAGQGYDGGNGYGSSTSGERAGGGGGGAANAGKDGTLGTGGDGGDGIEVWGKRYGGGGGGGGGIGGAGKDGGSSGGNAINIPAATPNTGSGGGGVRGSTSKSGDGASGVIRIRKKL